MHYIAQETGPDFKTRLTKIKECFYAHGSENMCCSLADVRREKENLEMYISNRCMKIEIASGSIVCKKCKSRHTNHTTVNTRSGDEGSTKFVICLDCGYEFRIG